MAGLPNDNTFTLLTEQLSRMTDELVSQRESHLSLVREVSQQNVVLASLAERISAHNRLLEERKANDHARIGSLETRMSIAEETLEAHAKWRWQLIGGGIVLLFVFTNLNVLLKWIT